MCRYGMLRLLGRNSWRFLSLSVSEGVTEFVGLSVSVCHCRSKYLSWVTVSFVTVHHTTRQSPSNRMSLVIAPPVTLSQYLLVTSSTTHTTRYSLSLLRQLLYVRHTWDCLVYYCYLVYNKTSHIFCRWWKPLDNQFRCLCWSPDFFPEDELRQVPVSVTLPESYPFVWKCYRLGYYGRTLPPVLK